MEDIAPSLSMALQLQLEMGNGQSFRESLRLVLSETNQNRFYDQLREWSVRKSHNQITAGILKEVSSPYRRSLLDLFERGWEGEPILEALQALTLEIQSASEAELDHFITTLPFRAMMPLLLLQFPAYLLLLLGPVLKDLVSQLGGP